MDDLWGDDDLDADVVEECLLATQASFATSSSANQHQNDFSSEIDTRENTRFEFKQPTSKSFYQNEPKQSHPTTQRHQPASKIKENSVLSNTSSTNYVHEIEKLKEENKKLAEANLMKTGESSILRADIQNLRLSMERREAETNQQIALLQKRIQQMDSQHQKQLEASKTELKFKEMELEELKSKCKRIEQSGKEMPKIGKHSIQPNSPLQTRKFPHRFTIDNGDRMGVFIDAYVQTDPCRESRLVISDERVDNTASIEVLVETVRFLLLSPSDSSESLSHLLGQMRLCILTYSNRDNLIARLHSCKPCVMELVLNNLERVKSPEDLRSHLDLLVSWISKVLPFIEAEKQSFFTNIILTEIRRLTFVHVMQLCSAVVIHLGLQYVCNSNLGCLLERAALQLKEGYSSLSPEDQFQAAKQLVLTLSATLASPTSGYPKKCACIPHSLKTLVLVIQHQIDLGGLTPYASDRRLKVLMQAFRLGQTILNSKTEPWLTFLQSPAEVNRIFTVLTAISLEFPIPRELTHEINVGAFVGP